MTGLNTALALLIIAMLPLKRYPKPRWVALAVATFFLSVQVIAVGLWLDSSARRAVVAELEAGRAVQHVSSVTIGVKTAQIQDRIAIALCGVGLFTLIVCAPRK